MNLFKSLKDMNEMVKAAPALIESAQQLAENAKASGMPAGTIIVGGTVVPADAQLMQHAAARAAHGNPKPENLEPIAGVSLDAYARVVKGIAAFGFDDSCLPEVAASEGITGENWAAAQSGWSARIQSDRGLGARFNELYTAV